MTSFVLDRASRYGEAEFLGNIDIGCEDLTEEQIEELRDLYAEKVRVLLKEFDSTLTWFATLSEVWGIVGETQTSPQDLAEWWNDGNDSGRWETAFLSAYDELEKTWASRNARVTETKSWRVYGRDGHRQRVSFEPSVRYDFSRGNATRIVEIECADKTGTNDYVRLIITRNSMEECDAEMRGQISDGIFENSRVGRIVEET